MATLIINEISQSLETLVRRAQQGDRAAFGELFERYERLVFSLALRKLGDYNEAQELCQDVFVQAMQKINQLREPSCFGSWLRSITSRMAINRRVRRAPDCCVEPETLEATCADNTSPLRSIMDGERDAQLHRGLAQLRSLDRETLVAFYVKGRSLNEMSVEFEAPLGTIKRRLHVARKRLAEVVEPLAV